MSRPLPRFTDEHLADERKLARILLETGERAPIVSMRVGAHLAVEAQRLRGIPVIGYGIGGTSPGSDPYLAMQHWPTR